MTADNTNLNSFTSTGSKFFYHTEAMRKLRVGEGQVITTHLMPTDICQDSCSFCSVATREGNVLRMYEMEGYINQLLKFGLKSVIISGGGNPLLYKCPETKVGISELITMLNGKGLEVGMITNGMPLIKDDNGRTLWKNLSASAMDMLTWVRVSMSGLDHKRKIVEVPDIDKSKTTLGFSYVYHDIYHEPLDKNHGKVSSVEDLISPIEDVKIEYGKDRLGWLTQELKSYVEVYEPTYLRLLPNCLEVSKIAGRCEELQDVANKINPDIAFVQYKPPSAPNKCLIGFFHPVMNSDGYCFPCDSCVLNAKADHKFSNPWRICHWTEISKIYENPVRSLIDNPKEQCPGCVFTKTNLLLEQVLNGMETPMPDTIHTHPNFI